MDRNTERLIWYILGATRGGPMRLSILKILKENPSNAHKISEILSVNYRTVEHHVKVLLENGLIVQEGNGYGKVYFLSPRIEDEFDLIEEFLKRKGVVK